MGNADSEPRSATVARARRAAALYRSRRAAGWAACLMFPRGYPGRYRWSSSGAVRTSVACRGGFCVGSSRGRVRTALVGAIATDAWQQAHEAVVSLWHRMRPLRENDGIGAVLDELQEQVLVARRDGDADTERALEGVWQLRLQQQQQQQQQQLRADPALA